MCIKHTHTDTHAQSHAPSENSLIMFINAPFTPAREDGAFCGLKEHCFPQLTPSEEAFLRNYAGVVHSQMSQLPQHNIDQGKALETALGIHSYMFEIATTGASGDVKSVHNHRRPKRTASHRLKARENPLTGCTVVIRTTGPDSLAER